MTTTPEPTELKTWEIDVEMRVRKTFIMQGPSEEDLARKMVEAAITMGAMLGANLSWAYKWTDGRSAYRPMPVETIVDNDPHIVAVREVSDGVEIVVPDPSEFHAGSIEKAIWETYGLLHARAMRLLGRDMAFSILVSRVTRELRRELGVEGTRDVLRKLADTMPEVSKFEVDDNG